MKPKILSIEPSTTEVDVLIVNVFPQFKDELLTFLKDQVDSNSIDISPQITQDNDCNLFVSIKIFGHKSIKTILSKWSLNPHTTWEYLISEFKKNKICFDRYNPNTLLHTSDKLTIKVSHQKYVSKVIFKLVKNRPFNPDVDLFNSINILSDATRIREAVLAFSFYRLIYKSESEFSYPEYTIESEQDAETISLSITYKI